jgi:phage/plasmid-like protein (TIGR03299 family)
MSDMVETMGLKTDVLGASWHAKENAFEGIKTAKEVCTISGLDWLNIQHDIPAWNAYIPHPSIPDAFIKNPELTDITVPGFKMNVRDKDNTVMGFVSDVYKPIQNYEAFDFLDNIVGSGNGVYHSAMCLYNKYNRPTRIAITMELKPIEVLNDKINNYLVISHSHDGLNAVKVFVTPVRVVCHNTLTLATEQVERDGKKAPKRYWSTKHTGDIEAKLQKAQETLELYNEYVAVLPEIAETMHGINLYDEEVEQLLDYLFPDDGTAGKSRMSNNADTMRTKIKLSYCDPSGDAYKFYGTGWGMYQAVTNVIEHINPFRNTGSARANREFQIIEGHPVTMRAQKAIMSLKE